MLRNDIFIFSEKKIQRVTWTWPENTIDLRNALDAPHSDGVENKLLPQKGQHVLPFLSETAAGSIIISQRVIIISQTTLCCWISWACLVLCNQCISTGTMLTKHNWLVWVNLLSSLVLALHNATCTAVIDVIYERINIACNTHNEVCDHNLNV